MASQDQLRSPRTGQPAAHVALVDVPAQAHFVSSVRGVIPAANGTTTLIRKTGTSATDSAGTGVSSTGSVTFTSFRIFVNGAIPWGAGTVTIQDTAGNQILQFPASVLTANASVNPTTATVVVNSRYHTGAATGEGIVAVVAGYTTGSPLQVVAFAGSAS